MEMEVEEADENVVGSYQHNVDTKLLASSESFEVSKGGWPRNTVRGAKGRAKTGGGREGGREG